MKRRDGGSQLKEETISSGDDTDYEVEDQFQGLQPKILDTHLNASSLSGESVISSTASVSDVILVETSSPPLKREAEDSSYDSNKYFRKKKRKNPQSTSNAVADLVIKNESSLIVKNEPALSIGVKEELSEDRFVMDPSMVDVKLEVKAEADALGGGFAEAPADDASQLVSLQAMLGPRDCERLLKLDTVRGWERTGLGEAMHTGEREKGPQDVEVRLLSYNILAQSNLARHGHLYRGKPNYLLEWDYRWRGLKRELLTLQPHILCLQEVSMCEPDHLSSHLRPWLEGRGYSLLAKQRTGGKGDGCLIAFKKDKFSLVSHKEVELRREGVPLLCKDNVGLVCCLQASNGSRLAVGTSHLLFNPKRHDVRLAQVAVMLAELESQAWSPQHRSCLPAILCGDFNLQPYSDSYTLLRRGHLAYSELRRLPPTPFPPQLGLTNSCQWLASLEERGKGGGASLPSGELHHTLGLRSVYRHSRHQDTRVPVGGYEATTFHGSWVTVDYIFYSTEESTNSPDGRREGRLKLLQRLALPTGPELSALGGLPSEIAASDHLPLAAHFLLKKF